MRFIEIVFTVCMLSQPTFCKEQHLQYSWNGSLTQCIMSAPPFIAHWINEHPKWQVTGWRCDYSGGKSSA
jgi:hypothetical protein